MDLVSVTSGNMYCEFGGTWGNKFRVCKGNKTLISRLPETSQNFFKLSAMSAKMQSDKKNLIISCAIINLAKIASADLRVIPFPFLNIYTQILKIILYNSTYLFIVNHWKFRQFFCDCVSFL